MQAEWARTFEGPPEVPRLIGALCEAAIKVGVPGPEWEFRRAELVVDEITYKYGRGDDRERALAACADNPERAHVAVTVFPSDTRDPLAVMHLDFDGRETRVRVESEVVRLLTHMRDALR